MELPPVAATMVIPADPLLSPKYPGLVVRVVVVYRWLNHSVTQTAGPLGTLANHVFLMSLTHALNLLPLQKSRLEHVARETPVQRKQNPLVLGATEYGRGKAQRVVLTLVEHGVHVQPMVVSMSGNILQPVLQHRLYMMEGH